MKLADTVLPLSPDNGRMILYWSANRQNTKKSAKLAVQNDPPPLAHSVIQVTMDTVLLENKENKLEDLKVLRCSPEPV